MNEPIALSKGTAVALAHNIHSNDVLEMTDFFETVPTFDNDNVECDCAKCLYHDDLQQTQEGESETGSAGSAAKMDEIPQPTTRGLQPTPATRGPQHLTPEPGQASSTQDDATKQEPTRSSGVVSTNHVENLMLTTIQMKSNCKPNVNVILKMI